jgi:valyl-tRNA synthetase
VPFHADIDVEAERAKLNKDIAHLEGFIRGVNGKLSNAQFVANAPAAVVELERKKAADAAAKLDVLRAKLAEWG